MILTTALVCMALNIYHEDRANGYDGMAAVAYVTMNRAKGDPEKVCQEVFRPKQFSWANSLTTVSSKQRIKNAKQFLPKEPEAWEAAKIVAEQALTGKLSPELVSKLEMANHYFNPNKANPSWQHSMQRIARIGEHVFYYG